MATKKETAKKPAAKKTTKKAAPKKESIAIDPNKVYTFIVDKDSKHMKKGSYTVDGVMAQVLIDKGLGSVKS